MSGVIEQIKFDEKGLVAAITQDYENGDVLMLAYMNKEALKLTLETGICHYFSRSRQKMWLKGETSGHKQFVKEVFYDCDADALLLKVDQKVAACHTGRRSCFFNKVDGDSAVTASEQLFDPDAVYGEPAVNRVFNALARDYNIGDSPHQTEPITLFRQQLKTQLSESAVSLTKLAEEGDKNRIAASAAVVLADALGLIASCGIDYSMLEKELVQVAEQLQSK
jgi:phosphoribosyl-AMP cyclohydrolase